MPARGLIYCAFVIPLAYMLTFFKLGIWVSSMQTQSISYISRPKVWFQILILLENLLIISYLSYMLFLIWSKVGGLGDVVTGLGKALQKRGHLVEIVLPKYDCMEYERIRDLRVFSFYCF